MLVVFNSSYLKLPRSGAVYRSKGSYVPVKDTVSWFQRILEGKYDDLPEDAFRLVGGIDEVIENAKKMMA